MYSRILQAACQTGLLWLLTLCVQPAVAAPNARDQARDRLQNELFEREQRRIDDAVLPGHEQIQPVTAAESSGPCFPVGSVDVTQLAGTEPSPLLKKVRHEVSKRLSALPECMTAEAIRQLQRDLGNWLINKGFVTSRLLLPEQSLADGRLEFVLAPGKIEELSVSGVPEARLRLALPTGEGEPLNLRDLEQAVENLRRARGTDASFGLFPGSGQGGTEVKVEGTQESSLGAALSLQEQVYGDIVHGVLIASGEWGSPTGLTDRLILSANTDLDDEISDHAWGVNLDYDIGIGYWLLGANTSYQYYSTDVISLNQPFEVEGSTSVTRLEASRVLRRSSVSRLSFGGYLGRTAVENLFEGTTLSVSSYDLSSTGLRMDYSRLWSRYQFGATVTAEMATAGGPATELGTDVVADDDQMRLQFYASLLRHFRSGAHTLQWRVHGQHTSSRLFSNEQFSLTAVVRGYEDLFVSGNSGLASSIEYAFNDLPGYWQMHWRPYLAMDAGLIPEHADDPVAIRLASATAGVSATADRIAAGMSVSSPLASMSTEDSDNSYTLSLTLQMSF